MDEPDLDADSLVLQSTMPLLLLSEIFLFPGCDLPLKVSASIQSSMVNHALENDQMFAVGCPSESGALFPVVTAGVIKSVMEFADGSSELVLSGLQRMRILGLNQLKPFPIVRVEQIPYSPVTPEEFDEWHEQLSLLIESRSNEWNDSFTQMADWVRRVEDPSMISDVVGYALVRDRKILRELLAEENTKKRMSLLLGTLEEERSEEDDGFE
jgi:ATP-dependent Lon protease